VGGAVDLCESNVRQSTLPCLDVEVGCGPVGCHGGVVGFGDQGCVHVEDCVSGELWSYDNLMIQRSSSLLTSQVGSDSRERGCSPAKNGDVYLTHQQSHGWKIEAIRLPSLTMIGKPEMPLP
jgi:hypothetical protein